MKLCSTSVILFVKYPEPGQVKSRLGKSIGYDRACNLYRSFVEDILDTLEEVDSDICIYIHREAPLKDLASWPGRGHQCCLQQGDDLGEKMERAFLTQFHQGYLRSIIIGSDIPHLQAEHVNEAVKALQQHDTVIGPTADGGYYLLGFNKESFLPSLFKDISWSTPEVYNITMERLKSNNRSTYVLRRYNDIDSIDDLLEYYRKEENHLYSPETVAFINGKLSELMED